MASDILSTSKVRFDISNDGWRRMNAGRSASELIREAVANAFDTDGATNIRVELSPGFASIEDDSPTGIGDPALITTVFLTGKTDSHTKRGRKGRGLKELLSAAKVATVDSVGHKVVFDEGRTVMTSNRTVGTKVSVEVPEWDQAQIDTAVAYLARVIPPPNMNLYINGVKTEPRDVLNVFNIMLETQIIEEGIQRNKYQLSDVQIVSLNSNDTEGWIYEMGIPVQAIKAMFHINVQQRVPLNDNRNMVDSYYLNAMYGYILDNTIQSMDKRALKAEWVTLGIPYSKIDTHRKFVATVFGELKGLVVKSKNKSANDAVKQHGFDMIDTAGMPSGIERIVSNVVANAELVATQLEESTPDTEIPAAIADPTGRITSLTRYLGLQLIAEDLEVKFFERDAGFTGHLRLADFNVDKKTIRFNVKAELWGADPLTPKMFSTICHEFAHNKFLEHNNEFHAEVERLSGKMAMLVLNRAADINVVAGVKLVVPEKGKLVINCQDCGAPREIFPQDAHQVRRCLPCTKRARTARAKKNRAGPHA